MPLCEPITCYSEASDLIWWKWITPFFFFSPSFTQFQCKGDVIQEQISTTTQQSWYGIPVATPSVTEPNVGCFQVTEASSGLGGAEWKNSVNGDGKSRKIRPKIIGGVRLPPQTWPFLVPLNEVDSNGVRVGRCGAVLISNQHLLTAAHCFYNDSTAISPSSFVARIGDYDYYERLEPYAKIVRIVDYSIDRRFDPDNLGNGYDIAVAKLEIAVSFNSWVQPLCLPDGISLPVLNTPCMVAG